VYYYHLFAAESAEVPAMAHCVDHRCTHVTFSPFRDALLREREARCGVRVRALVVFYGDKALVRWQHEGAPAGSSKPLLG
jgi:hypothetical protein